MNKYIILLILVLSANMVIGENIVAQYTTLGGSAIGTLGNEASGYGYSLPVINQTSWQVTQIEIYVNKTGLPIGNVWMCIYNITTGSITNKVNCSYTNYSMSNINTTPTFLNFTFGNNLTMYNGQRYFYGAETNKANGDSSNYVTAGYRGFGGANDRASKNLTTSYVILSPLHDETGVFKVWNGTYNGVCYGCNMTESETFADSTNISMTNPVNNSIWINNTKYKLTYNIVSNYNISTIYVAIYNASMIVQSNTSVTPGAGIRNFSYDAYNLYQFNRNQYYYLQISALTNSGNTTYGNLINFTIGGKYLDYSTVIFARLNNNTNTDMLINLPNNTQYINKEPATFNYFPFEFAYQKIGVNYSRNIYANSTTNFNYFNGTIEKFFTYNKTLNQSEIEYLYDKYKGSTNVNNESNSTMYFDGYSYLMIENITKVVNNPSYSISYWMKNINSTVYDTIFSDGSNSTNIYINSLNQSVYNHSTITNNITLDIGDTDWHNYVYVNNNGSLSGYKDGVLISNISYSGNYSYSAKPFYISANPDNISGTLNAYYLDEFMYFNRVLSSDEIYVLANGYSPLNWANVTVCQPGDDPLLKYTIYDQSNKTLLENTTLEAAITLRSDINTTRVLNFSIKITDNPAQLCTPFGLLNYSNFTMNATIRYYNNDHEIQYKYIRNYRLNLSTNNITDNLYDLSKDKSTTFLVTYQDANYLYVPDMLLDLTRQYIDMYGNYISVEHAITDASGQTRLHFEAEDAIYKINVLDVNNNLVYTTDQFIATCQAYPCVVTLRLPYNYTAPESSTSNITYTISNESEVISTNIIQVSYVATDNIPVNLSITATKSLYNSNVTVCTSSIFSTSGTINCNIPVSYQNASYIIDLYKDGEILGTTSYNLQPNTQNPMSDTGIFFGGIGFLTLSLMSLASPAIAIILGLIGLAAMIMMNLLNGGALFGILSTFIFILIAGIVLVWKFANRRVG